MNTENLKNIVTNCYHDLLNREPDKSGLEYYLSILKNNKINVPQLSELIKSSPEFLESHPESIPNPIFPEKLESIPDPKIVAMYRIKNEERWIEKSLKITSEICQEIVILDDGSTDDTLKICKKFPSVVDIHSQTNLPFDETRDKNILLKMAMKLNPDFLLSVDGDEIIMPGMKQILKEDLTVLHPKANVYQMQLLEVREKPNQIRINDSTTNGLFPTILRLKNQPSNLHFEEMKFPGNAHCPKIPQNAYRQKNPAVTRCKILHYSLYDEKIRNEKYNFLTKLDPNNTEFFGYKHLIEPEKYCGPLEYAYLPKGSYIEDIK